MRHQKSFKNGFPEQDTELLPADNDKKTVASNQEYSVVLDALNEWLYQTRQEVRAFRQLIGDAKRKTTENTEV